MHRIDISNKLPHQIDMASERKRTGLRYDPTYAAWAAAKQRCTNPRNPAYHNYGGRGITMCGRWLASYSDFLADMGPKPDGGRNVYLDRIDPDGNYEPGNCRWVNSLTNAQNVRKTRKFWMYVHEDFLRRIDKWSADYPVAVSSRADAYRRIADFALDLLESIPESALVEGESQEAMIRAAIEREIERRLRA